MHSSQCCSGNPAAFLVPLHQSQNPRLSGPSNNRPTAAAALAAGTEAWQRIHTSASVALMLLNSRAAAITESCIYIQQVCAAPTAELLCDSD